MKLKVNGFDIEGTPQEVKNLLEIMNGQTEVKVKKPEVISYPKHRTVREKTTRARYPNKYKTWSRAEDEAVGSTLSARRIAKQLGRSYKAVYSRRYQLKVLRAKQNGK